MLMPSQSQATGQWGVDNLTELRDVSYAELQEQIARHGAKEGLWALVYEPGETNQFKFKNLDEYITQKVIDLISKKDSDDRL